MTQPIDPNKIAYTSQMDALKVLPKTSGFVDIPSQSYTGRQIRAFSFDIPLPSNNAIMELYLNFGFEAANLWQLQNGSTFLNHPQNMEINVYTQYGVGVLTVRVTVVNRVGTVTLNPFRITGKIVPFEDPF